MKKTFWLYLVGWTAILGLFNIIVFVTPNEIGGQEKFTPLFWIGYVLITFFFIVQLATIFYVTKMKSLEKVFYSIPLIKKSVYTLVTMLICGGICMAFIKIPTWIGIVICSIVFVINIISLIRGVSTVEILSGMDKKVENQTFFIKMLRVDAEVLVTKAISPESKKIANKIFEEIRFSDPMSSEELKLVEARIAEKFTEFSSLIEKDNLDEIRKCSNELSSLIKERNLKCKLFK